jgi:predicted transposase YbfD/YdcC
MADMVRRKLIFPKSFLECLEKVRKKQGSRSDSEILREAINLLESCKRKKKGKRRIRRNAKR